MQFIMALRGILGTLVLFVSLLNVSTAATDAELTQKYRFSKMLDTNHDNYKLYWSFDKQEETISFAVRVGTSGWVGFGLSPDGQMFNSDVVIGWVDDSGTTHFHVCHLHLFDNILSNNYRIVVLVPDLVDKDQR